MGETFYCDTGLRCRCLAVVHSLSIRRRLSLSSLLSRCLRNGRRRLQPPATVIHRSAVAASRALWDRLTLERWRRIGLLGTQLRLNEVAVARNRVLNGVFTVITK